MDDCFGIRGKTLIPEKNLPTPEMIISIASCNYYLLPQPVNFQIWRFLETKNHGFKRIIPGYLKENRQINNHMLQLSAGKGVIDNLISPSFNLLT